MSMSVTVKCLNKPIFHRRIRLQILDTTDGQVCQELFSQVSMQVRYCVAWVWRYPAPQKEHPDTCCSDHSANPDWWVSLSSLPHPFPVRSSGRFLMKSPHFCQAGNCCVCCSLHCLCGIITWHCFFSV